MPGTGRQSQFFRSRIARKPVDYIKHRSPVIGPPEKPRLGESPGSRSGWYFAFPPETTNLAFTGNTHHKQQNGIQKQDKHSTRPNSLVHHPSPTLSSESWHRQGLLKSKPDISSLLSCMGYTDIEYCRNQAKLCY